jgi:hypothetical protein
VTSEGLRLWQAARSAPWWLTVFLLALGLRLGYILLANPPLGYSTALSYIWEAMDLAARLGTLRQLVGGDGQ